MSLDHKDIPQEGGHVEQTKKLAQKIIDIAHSYFSKRAKDSTKALPEAIVAHSTDFLTQEGVERIWKKSHIRITDLPLDTQTNLPANNLHVASQLIKNWTEYVRTRHTNAGAFFNQLPLCLTEKKEISSFLLHKLALHTKEISTEGFIEAYFIALEEYLEEQYGRERQRVITKPLSSKKLSHPPRRI